MVDYDLYNERRQQLIESFEDQPSDFLSVLGGTIVDLVDNLEWEDNEELARLMGWTTDDDEE